MCPIKAGGYALSFTVFFHYSYYAYVYYIYMDIHNMDEKELVHSLLLKPQLSILYTAVYTSIASSQ